MWVSKIKSNILISDYRQTVLLWWHYVKRLANCWTAFWHPIWKILRKTTRRQCSSNDATLRLKEIKVYALTGEVCVFLWEGVTCFFIQSIIGRKQGSMSLIFLSRQADQDLGKQILVILRRRRDLCLTLYSLRYVFGCIFLYVEHDII